MWETDRKPVPSVKQLWGHRLSRSRVQALDELGPSGRGTSTQCGDRRKEAGSDSVSCVWRTYGMGVGVHGSVLFLAVSLGGVAVGPGACTILKSMGWGLGHCSGTICQIPGHQKGHWAYHKCGVSVVFTGSWNSSLRGTFMESRGWYDLPHCHPASATTPQCLIKRGDG